MNAHAQLHWRENFDQPWRRLPWIILGALAAWVVLLASFARMLEQRALPQPPPAAIEARIVEIPAPAGLQGGGAPAHPAMRPAPLMTKPVPKARPKPTLHHAKKLEKAHPIAMAPPSAFGTLKHAEHPVMSPPAAGPASGAIEHGSASVREGGGVGGGTGTGAGAGLGSDSSGARAMYAPTPTIPDDMRETPFSTVAVAHFKVSPEGDVRVTLLKPTPNPRLNEILLETLRQWKFFPAMKDGVAVTSDFDVRIPIAVQ